ncbi:MAG: ribosomal-processing cysteine protease Prp [Coprococcus sp.]
MINVTILKNSNSEPVGFQMSGHAEYADPGEDIVCSAASAIAITTVNSIELLTDDDFSVECNQENGDMNLLIKGVPGHDVIIIMKTYEIGITKLYESYDDYICLTFKEV